MDLPKVVSQAKAGNPDAFTLLHEHYQHAAFGYAYSMLRDFQAAQDVTQHAFIGVYLGLPSLKEPDKFPAWLRGIVRHECLRVVRKRKLPLNHLESALDVPAEDATPDQHLETQETSATVSEAINALPPLLREATILYYINDFSQQEVATLLGVPVSAVNNRLYAARQRLRTSLAPPAAVTEEFDRNRLPEDFTREIGRIVSAQGPFVDVRHDPENSPAIFAHLTADKYRRGTLVVAQHAGDGLTRCIATDSITRWGTVATGTVTIGTGNRSDLPLDLGTLRAVVRAVTGGMQRGRRSVLETGIKAIDFACPFPEDGCVAIFGDAGAGKLAIVNEIVRGVTAFDRRLTLFVFVRSLDELPFLRSLSTAGEEIYAQSGTAQVIYLLSGARQEQLAELTTSWFDASVFVSRSLAERRIYPAIDMLACHSDLINPAVVGAEHFAVLDRVKRTLAELGRRSTLSTNDRLMGRRADRLEAFTSQPMFIAEAHTNQPGCFVPRTDTVRSFRDIVSGLYDDTPVRDLLFRGALGPLPDPRHVHV